MCLTWKQVRGVVAPGRAVGIVQGKRTGTRCDLERTEGQQLWGVTSKAAMILNLVEL